MPSPRPCRVTLLKVTRERGDKVGATEKDPVYDSDLLRNERTKQREDERVSIIRVLIPLLVVLGFVVGLIVGWLFGVWKTGWMVASTLIPEHKKEVREISFKLIDTEHALAKANSRIETLTERCSELREQYSETHEQLMEELRKR